MSNTVPATDGPVTSVLVANRGVIARRIIRSARAMGLRTVAVFSDADADLPYVEEADAAVRIGGPAPQDSYLDAGAILTAAAETGVDAIHPGYGFLSENADFARKVLGAGLIWVGPDPETIRVLGDKARARRQAAHAGMPVGSGSDDAFTDVENAVTAGAAIGYPLMVKAVAGGGGIGMSVVRDEDGLRTGFASATATAHRYFGDDRVMVERYVERARHVEIQILGLADGRVVSLGARDCSVQRRNQKIAEEAPSPELAPETLAAMEAAAVALGRSAGYRNAGTVECLLDRDTGRFTFLEMNTRLQVEHGVTEMVTGLDLVQEQLLVAGAQPPGFDPGAVTVRGHALELRIYAEDPGRFLPSPGRISRWDEPSGDGVRVESGYRAGNEVTHFYDPLLAKLILWGESRHEALERARAAVSGFRIDGVRTNLPFFARLLDDPRFRDGAYDTGLVAAMQHRPDRVASPTRTNAETTGP